MNISLTSLMNGRKARSLKKLLITFLATFSLLASHATNYTSVAGATNWNTPASWTPVGIPVAGDNVTISVGTVTVSAAAACTNITISGGTLVLNAGLTVGGVWMYNSGTFTPNLSTVTFNGTTAVSGSATTTFSGFTISGGTLTQNAANMIITGSFTNNAAFTHNNKIVTFGTGGIIAGSANTVFSTLTINAAANTDKVVLSSTLATIRDGGVLNLTKGIFKLTGKTLQMTKAATINVVSPSNFANSLDGAGDADADGGTIELIGSSGGTTTVTNNATFYDIKTTGGNVAISLSTTGTRIHGTLSIVHQQFQFNTNPPVWGPASTLSVNNTGSQYTPGGGNHKEWMQIAPGAGTIGTTPGYPNNVVIANVGSSASNYNGNQYGVKLSGGWSINGTLQVGTSSSAGLVDLNNGGGTPASNHFTCGGIIIENNSKLAAPGGNFNVKGNWLRTGGTIGTFIHNSATVTFSGGTGSGSPQGISVSTGTETQFNNVTLSGANTYVKLNSPVTLSAGSVLNLTSGILETSTTNILSITNTAVTGITGAGSSTTFINGPVKWNIALASKYSIPLGKGTVYLPFDITPGAATANTITAEAFNINSNGAPDGTTVTAISNTEYWSLTATGTFTSGASVSAARVAGNGSNNMLAKSTTASGIYSAIGGTSGTVGSITGISNSGTIGSSSPWFFTLAYGPLSINVVSITYPGCTGTGGAVTVAGTGGVIPYTYNINSGAYQASGAFTGLAAGTYVFGVKDNLGATSSISINLQALAATTDTGTCVGGSVQLQANSAPAWGYTWSPATGLSSTIIANPVATPAATTAYTVSAIIVNPTTNLVTNPGFESGNTGFTSNYIPHACGPYYSSTTMDAPNPWPCAGNTTPQGPGPYATDHNGLYKISGNAQNLCVNLANFGPRTGSNMMIVDGANKNTFSALPFWQQTYSGLSINTYYVFTYWVRNAFTSVDGSAPIVKTKINSTDATGTVAYPNPYTVNTLSWTQLSYLWYSGAGTTATIEIYDDRLADASNDFAIDDLSFYITCQPTASVTVSITVTPTLNTIAQPVQACAGSGASINLTGLTAVDTFTVNYTINGVAQMPIAGIISDGSGNASFTSAVLSALNNGEVLQVTSLTNTGAHSSCTQTFTGKTVTLAVNATGTWLGATNTDWNTASNWCGGVPTAATDVLVPDYGVGGTYPVIYAVVAGTCRNIILSANASVTINKNGSLAVSGTYSSNGALTNNGELIFNSSSVAQSFPGPTGTVSAMNNITINNTSGLGVTFNRDFSIYGVLTPTAGIVDVNNALVTLTSTDTSNARVGIVGEGFTYTGTGQFAVERYYPAQRSWRLVTAPLYATNDIFVDWQLGGAVYGAGNMGRGLLITGPTATSPIGPDGLDISQQQNPSLRVGATLTPVVNTHVPLSKNAGTSADNLGYFIFVRGDRDPNNTIIPFVNVTTVTSKGKLQTGPQVFAGNPLANKLELIGNPYASPVSFKTLGRSNLKNRFYAWDPSLNDQGGYVIVDDILNTGSYTKSPTSPGGQDSLIQSCQAIYVETIANGPSVLTFNETDKATQNNLGMFRPALPIARQQAVSLRTNLYIINPASAPVLADGNLVQFGENFVDAVDGDDATKPVNVHETFGLLRYGKVLGIERRPLINDRDTLFFNLKSFQQRTYRFEFTPTNIINTVAYLEDKYLNRTTRLNMNRASSFDFTINADPLSAAAGRFKIIFRKAADLISINAGVSFNNVQVKWQKEENVFDQYIIERSADGTSFEKVAVLPAEKNTNGKTTYSWTDNEVVPGEYYYRVKGDIIDNTVQEDEKYYSNEARVVLDKTNRSGVYVFPNPVSGKIIQLQMNSMPAGKYAVALVDNNGREVVTGNINHAANSSVEKISIKAGLPGGNYHLKISGPGNYQSTLKILYK